MLDRLQEERGERLHLAHRLDRATAGVLLLGRGVEQVRQAARGWDLVEKQYWALVFGRAKAPLVIDAPLRDQDGKAQSAKTEVLGSLLLSQAGPISACLVRIKTGRLHQIRRHLAGVDWPVVMDDKYGDFAANKRFRTAASEDRGGPRPKHNFLLCRRLVAPPESGLPPRLEAPFPPSWRSLLDTLRVSVDDLLRLE